MLNPKTKLDRKDEIENNVSLSKALMLCEKIRVFCDLGVAPKRFISKNDCEQRREIIEVAKYIFGSFLETI